MRRLGTSRGSALSRCHTSGRLHSLRYPLRLGVPFHFAACGLGTAESHMGGGQSGGTTGPSMPTTWVCIVCQFTNFAFRNSCLKCRASKQARTPLPVGFDGVGTSTGVPQIEMRSSNTGEETSSSPLRTTSASPSIPQPVVRILHGRVFPCWWCECGAQNTPMSITCCRCGRDHPITDGVPTQPFQSPQAPWICHYCKAENTAPDGVEEHSQVGNKASCTTCGQSRVAACNICGHPSEEVFAGSICPSCRGHALDWQCMGCGFWNYHHRPSCLRCYTQKSLSTPHQPVSEFSPKKVLENDAVGVDLEGMPQFKQEKNTLDAQSETSEQRNESDNATNPLPLEAPLPSDSAKSVLSHALEPTAVNPSSDPFAAKSEAAQICAGCMTHLCTEDQRTGFCRLCGTKCSTLCILKEVGKMSPVSATDESRQNRHTTELLPTTVEEHDADSSSPSGGTVVVSPVSFETEPTPELGSNTCYEWTCLCGATNLPSSSRCHECSSEKQTIFRSTSLDEEGGGTSASASASGLPETAQRSTSAQEDGVWMCPCGAANMAFRTECFSCERPASEEDLQIARGHSLSDRVLSPETSSSASMSDSVPPNSIEDMGTRGAGATHSTTWTCSFCSFANFPFRNDCFACTKPRNTQAIPTESFDGMAHANKSSIVPPYKMVSMETWKCTCCGAENIRDGSTTCSRCHASQSNSVPQQAEAIHRTPLNNNSSSSSDNHNNNNNSHQAPSSVKPDTGGASNYAPDWVCGACRFLNFARRVECKACRTIRGAEAATISAPPSAPAHSQMGKGRSLHADWTCVCGTLNTIHRRRCIMCGLQISSDNESNKTHVASPFPQTPSSLPPPRGGGSISLRPGDWHCTCGALNFSTRNACYRCSSPRIDANLDIRRRESGSMSPPTVPHTPFHRGSRSPDAGRADWLCSCGAKNFSSRLVCYVCAGSNSESTTTGRTVATAPSRMNAPPNPASMWTCGQCGVSNFATREVCFKCFAGRTATVSSGASPVTPTFDIPPYPHANRGGEASLQRPGDWYCGACTTLNFAARGTCFRCSRPRHQQNEHEKLVNGGGQPSSSSTTTPSNRSVSPAFPQMGTHAQRNSNSPMESIHGGISSELLSEFGGGDFNID